MGPHWLAQHTHAKYIMGWSMVYGSELLLYVMLCEDEKWHPCAYLSKGLNDVERNYDVHDKEMLGII
jgi:hypothetical protein